MTNKNPPRIEVHDVSYQYTKQGKTMTVKDLTLFPGDCLGVIGQNGSGKTTFLKLLLRLLTPLTGHIRVNKQEKYQAYPLMGYLPTFTHAFFSSVTVQEEIMNFMKRVHSLKHDQENNGTHLSWLLNKWQTHLKKSPFLLSLGEQQQLVLDLLEVQNPSIILLDEPEKGLDPLQKQELHERINKWLQQEKTIVLSSHFSSLILKLCTKLVVFHDNGETRVYNFIPRNVVLQETIFDGDFTVDSSKGNDIKEGRVHS